MYPKRYSGLVCRFVNRLARVDTVAYWSKGVIVYDSEPEREERRELDRKKRRERRQLRVETDIKKGKNVVELRDSDDNQPVATERGRRSLSHPEHRSIIEISGTEYRPPVNVAFSDYVADDSDDSLVFPQTNVAGSSSARCPLRGTSKLCMHTPQSILIEQRYTDHPADHPGTGFRTPVAGQTADGDHLHAPVQSPASAARSHIVIWLPEATSVPARD